MDSFDVNRVIVAGFLLWSLSTAATGLVRGFTMLLAMRLILGTGESVMSPAYSKILSFHLPEHHRGFANGVLQAAVRSENLAALLSYVFGWLTGLIFLLLEKRPYVRFYAAQSIVVPGLAHRASRPRCDIRHFKNPVCEKAI